NGVSLTFTTPLRLRKIHTTVLDNGNMMAQKNPRKVCRYCALRSRTINRHASSRLEAKSSNISRTILRGLVSSESGVYMMTRGSFMYLSLHPFSNALLRAASFHL